MRVHAARSKEVTPCWRHVQNIAALFAVAQASRKNTHNCFCVTMGIFSVYVVYARTKRGTIRIYVGSTYALDLRKFFHTLPSRPCWLRACLAKDVPVSINPFKKFQKL